MENNKETRIQWEAIKSLTDMLPHVSMPTVFRLRTNDVIISGPIDDVSTRLNMSNMMWLFNGGQLPFEWYVVGYLYPVEAYGAYEADNFLDMMEKGLSELSNNFIPHSRAIMFPLLIMR